MSSKEVIGKTAEVGLQVICLSITQKTPGERGQVVAKHEGPYTIFQGVFQMSVAQQAERDSKENESVIGKRNDGGSSNVALSAGDITIVCGTDISAGNSLRHCDASS